LGKAASINTSARRARAAVETGRDQVARAFGRAIPGNHLHQRRPESDNHASFGNSSAPLPAPSKHIITTISNTEAVLNTCQALELKNKKTRSTVTIPSKRQGVITV